MDILYNSDNFYVLEYLYGRGYEVMDKNVGRGTFLLGDVADRFRSSMIGAIKEDASIEHVDEFLAGFGVLQQLFHHAALRVTQSENHHGGRTAGSRGNRRQRVHFWSMVVLLVEWAICRHSGSDHSVSPPRWPFHLALDALFGMGWHWWGSSGTV